MGEALRQRCRPADLTRFAALVEAAGESGQLVGEGAKVADLEEVLDPFGQDPGS